MRYLAMDTCQLLSGTGASQQSNLMSILLPLEKLLKEQHRALVTDTPRVAEAWGWCNTSTPTPSHSRSAHPRHAASGFSHRTSIFRRMVSLKRKIETSQRKHYSKEKLFEEFSFF